MTRFTKRLPDGEATITDLTGVFMNPIIDTLARYEEIGLTPEEIVQLSDKEHIEHGEWIPVDEMEDAFDCSICDAMVMFRYAYCPKCKSRMDKINQVFSFGKIF